MRIAGLALLVCGGVFGQPLPAPPTPEDLFRAVRTNDLATLRTGAIRKTAGTAKDAHGSTLLMHVAAFGSVEAMRILLDAGVPVNARNDLQATALLWAAGDFEKVRLLVAEGAEVNARSKLGRTALMAAAAEPGNSETVALLLAHGADAKAVDSGGGTALMDAARMGDAKSVKLLLAAGAEVNHADGLGWTPLMAASIGGDAEAVRALIEKGADAKHASTVAPRVKFGDVQMNRLTALMLGAPFNSPASTKALVDAGADVNARDMRGMTPLMLAVATEREDVARVETLLNAGADLSAKDAHGATALDWAQRYGYSDTVAALRRAGAPRSLTASDVARPEMKARTAQEAMEAATALLGKSAGEFFKQSGCVGCHHQPMAVVALVATQKSGIKVDEAAMRSLTQVMTADWTRQQEALLERNDSPGAPDGEGYVAWAFQSAGYGPTAVTDAVAVNVAAQQRESGCWHVGDISRAPVQEGGIARTARAVRLLQSYAPPALKDVVAKRVERARACMAATKVVTNDDRAMQMVGLHWVSGGPVTEMARALLKEQRADGGWAQNPNLESDALATGETLWALREVGASDMDAAAHRRGVEFLLRTQWPDGAWYVKSRAPKIQPYFQSGFPFEEDQWVSAAGTAWAVLGLAGGR